MIDHELERGRLLFQVEKIRVRQPAIDAVGQFYRPEIDVSFGGGFVERVEDDAVERRVNRRARADAERKRKDDDGGETGGLCHLAESEAEIVHGSSE
jgi:hypothetical protein